MTEKISISTKATIRRAVPVAAAPESRAHDGDIIIRKGEGMLSDLLTHRASPAPLKLQPAEVEDRLRPMAKPVTPEQKQRALALIERINALDRQRDVERRIKNHVR